MATSRTLSGLFSSLRSSRLLAVLWLLIGLLAIVWICTFKIMDRDFWWHITAGQIMLQTHSIIRTDPFAYTRAGLPYLATHEWLAQIVLFLIYKSSGSTGIILFRAVIASASVGLLLLLAKKPRFLYILLAVWAVVITKGSYLERPQLFTFVFFAAFILLAFRFLDAASFRVRRNICIAFVILELLWVNMHGGAALVGCALVTFLFVQMFLEVYFKRKNNLPVLWLLLGTLILMGLSLISPPNGFGTLTYLSQLTHDRTIAFIAEWQPRAWSAYLLDLWPFLLLSFFALAVGKKQWIFNGLLLCMTIYLSRQAVRHEILCIYASIATVFYQLDRSVWIGRAEEWMKQKYILAAVLLIILLVTATHTAIARSFAYERPDNLFGFGQFDLARGATDFIEREHITGNMFNTYGIGGYLINRGYPDRKVFIDGRNVDYGFDFMAHTYAAGINPDHWKELENTYNLSYALIDYDAIKQKGSLPYSMILDHNPDWSLVYLDDWVAVYLKNIPSNQPVISRLKYALLNPTDLQLHDTFDAVSDSDLPALVTELQRMSKESPTSIKGLVALGKISLKQNHLEDAEKYATEAMHLRPYAAEPVALIAGAYVQAQDWVRAADAYRHLLSLVGNDYPNVDHAFMKQIFEKAKQSTTGAQKTKEVSASGSVMKSAVASGTGNLAVNPLGDAITFNEQGLAQAGAGQYDKAMQSFSAAVLLNPGFAEAWNNVCALDLTLKKFPDALDACRHAVAINATYADAHFNLALALFDSALFTEAEKEALLAKKLGRVQESDQLLLNIRKKTQ